MMNVITMHGKEEVDIEKFWKVESMGVESISKESEYDVYLSLYQDNSIDFKDNKYTAKLPWRDDHNLLPTNEFVSRRRTAAVIDRLKKDPSLLKTYGDIIKEQKGRGFIEKVHDIHLELVPNMTSESFLLATRRFFSRRSQPRIMMSDNALTFIAASKVFQDEMNSRGITWKFIPQHAPWYGGWWERLTGVTKNCIKKVLGKSLVSLGVLQTIITEVECIVNDRPLTHSSSDPLDKEPLTPSHLLYGRRITSPIYPDDRHDATIDNLSHGTANKLFRLRSATIERFWSRWKHEYLTSLREFHRRNQRNGDTVRAGDVVQLHDDIKPRCRWSLGVIEDVIVGADGRVRAARVKCRGGVTTRPITKLHPLEV